jgi:hypothetical protein
MREIELTYKINTEANVRGDSPDRRVIHFEANDVKRNANKEMK